MSADGHQLERIRAKLERVRTVVDPGCTRFAAAKHRYRLGPTLEPLALTAVAHLLPPDFRRFLCEVGNGGAGPYHGWPPFDPRVYENRSLHPFRAAEGDEPGSATVFLHEHGCGMYDFLVLRGEGEGLVWFSDDHCEAHRYGLGFVDHYEAWLDGLIEHSRSSPVPAGYGRGS